MPFLKQIGLWKPILLIVLVIALIIVGRQIDLGSHIETLRTWIDSLGPWGPFVFLLLYIIAVIVAIPGSAITAVAGVLFGSLLGIIIVSTGATIGAALCFLISRYFARDTVTRRFATNKHFAKLDKMTEEYGAIMVAITRLIPIFPFNLLNYGFGLTRVPFWTYVGWSWLCMLPGTVLYVVGIDAVSTTLTEGEVPWPLLGILVVMGLILILLVQQARKKIKHKSPGATP